ncbi:unnamed protein product [Albugo candida]|uniref:Cyclin-dependent kinase 2 homolog n=1 Tax=Albugo candida TaxID=65357 RepID=A0A024GKC1_9STRA|nr:unnamed protein product [Albugo candida]|eukprot:CCI46939.1 unnamed protein product [Albugo candida]
MEASPDCFHTNDSGNHQSESSSSYYYSPLPPCPDDPPAPPPPSCTPPKYHSCTEEDEDQDQLNRHSSGFDDCKGDEKSQDENESDERVELYSNSPPQPPPPMQTVCSPDSPIRPPPPPFTPIVSSGIDDNQADRTPVHYDGLNRTRNDGVHTSDSKQKSDLTKCPMNTVALMRREASLREVLSFSKPQIDETTEKPRWYMGDIDDYTIIDKVGCGTYGEVFKCQHKVTKQIAALKKLRPNVEKNGFPITSIREMKILKFLKHPNIVKMNEIVSTKALPKEGKRPPLYFAFEYMEHDLSGLLNHPRVKLSRTQTQCYMRQLLCGIAFMHHNKIVHRDIKASNLLLNNQGMLKIGDFGLSRFWNEVNANAGRYTNKVVTLWYRPPELLLGTTSYDYSVDMWSIGCIFAELLTGRAILQGKTEIDQLKAIFELCGAPTDLTWPTYHELPGSKTFQFDVKYESSLRERFSNFPQHAVDLLEKMLTLDPSKRITAMEALDHDYFWRVLTCKPRDLPKFCVSSTHEYQSKKRHHAEIAAAAAVSKSNGKPGNSHHYTKEQLEGARGRQLAHGDQSRLSGKHDNEKKYQRNRDHSQNAYRDWDGNHRNRDTSRDHVRTETEDAHFPLVKRHQPHIQRR